ncbi:MAG: DNA translocase FtsK [Alphaproteobacteria bacterium]
MRKRVQPKAHTTLLPPALVEFLKHRWDDLVGLTFFLIGAYIAVALYSYDHTDPSWNTAVEGGVENIMGAYGAVIADVFTQYFSFASVLIVAALVSWCRIKMQHRTIALLWLRVLLVPVTMAVLCLVLSVLTDSLGGALGHMIYTTIHSFVPFTYRFWVDSAIVLLGSGLFLSAAAFVMAMSWQEWTQLAAKLSAMALWVYKLIANMITKLSQGTEAPSRSVPVRQEAAPLDLDYPKVEEDSRPHELAFAEDVDEDEIAIAPLDLQGGENYQLPPLDLLAKGQGSGAQAVDKVMLEENALQLKKVLNDFGIRGDITEVRPGPVVTLYELVPAPGIKSSRIIGLADDIARSMCAVSARVAVVPGRNAIGIELPNDTRQTVFLRQLLASQEYERSGAGLAVALGQDISGTPVVADLARMPHLLVAGTTGSGKSVGVNSMILSLVFRLPPDRCKLIMIDPKMLELSVYDDIPHLLTPVVTDPKKAVVALKWTVKEMEDRYRAMAKLGVRNILGYNQRISEAKANGETITREVQTGFDPTTGKPIFETQPLELEPLPYIVVVVDEMADLMLVAGKDIEAAVQRLAQMARAAGIHLIMATQRPSVDVITGTIKANFPTRISFQVTSKIDSRTILGEQGAEQLLGMGDMLYMAPGGRIIRVHGAFVSDKEVENVVQYLKTQGQPSYIDDVTVDEEDAGATVGGSGDDLYDQAVQLILREQKVSTSFIQRHLQIGYNRAARIVEKMEKEGVVSPANRTGKREILMG